jgi:hypothetical protein
MDGKGNVLYCNRAVRQMLGMRGDEDIAIYDRMTKADLLQHFTAASSGQLSDDPAKVKFYRARRV